MQSPRVGFVGLGIMGAPMAGHLLEAGYPLTVFNRTADKAEPLCRRGARRASSPAEAAREADVVIVIVSDSPDVAEVIEGPSGVLEGVQSGAVVIDMSTASPAVDVRLAAALADRGARLVDAPVSGGARQGTLAVMAGGEQGAFDEVRPLFECFGASITHCGPVGSGQLTKLCNQILVSANLLGVCEAISLARRSGLDPSTMIEAVNGGAAGSWQLANLGPKILEGDFEPGFMIELMQKDLRLVMEAASDANAPLPAATLVHQLFHGSQAAGDGGKGTQALYRALARLTGEPGDDAG